MTGVTALASHRLRPRGTSCRVDPPRYHPYRDTTGIKGILRNETRSVQWPCRHNSQEEQQEKQQ